MESKVKVTFENENEEKMRFQNQRERLFGRDVSSM